MESPAKEVSHDHLGRDAHDFCEQHGRGRSVPDTIAMKITGHKTRSVLNRYDITSEEDLIEAARKLQVLAGTISRDNGANGRGGVAGAIR